MVKQLFVMFFTLFSTFVFSQNGEDPAFKNIPFKGGEYPLVIINETVQQFSVGLFSDDPLQGGKLISKYVLGPMSRCHIMLPVDKHYFLITHQITDRIETRKLSLTNVDNRQFRFIRSENKGKTVMLTFKGSIDPETKEPLGKALYLFNRVYEFVVNNN